MVRRWAVAVLLTTAVGTLASEARAQTFNSGIPASWTCLLAGNCGTMGASGVVALPPTSATGSTAYGFVSTVSGPVTGGLQGIGGTNGSVLRSNLFSALANDALNFYFDYVTSDGSGYPDYAWARLLNPDLSEAALLFTARTMPNGNMVPGQGMPSPIATLNPSTVVTHAGTSWGALGSSSGTCWALGCGNSDWVFSSFLVPTAGNYMLEFGVTNFNDTAYQSGLAFDGVTIGGVPIEDGGSTVTPEPVTMILFGTGLAGLLGARKRRQKA